MGTGPELPHSLPGRHSPHVSTCSPISKLSKAHPWFLWRFHYTQSWLIELLAIGNWVNLQPLDPLQRSRAVLKVPPSNQLAGLLLWQPAAILMGSATFKSSLLNITRDTFISRITYEIPRGYRSPVPEIQGVDQIDRYISYNESQCHSHPSRLIQGCSWNERVATLLKFRYYPVRSGSFWLYTYWAHLF